MEGLKKIVNDDLIWRTEYECEFCSGAGTAFPPEWLVGMDSMPKPSDLDSLPHYLGFDVARTGDFSAFAIASRLKDGTFYVHALHKLKDSPFNQQMEFVRSLNDKWHFTGGFTDSTGIGGMIAEEIARTINGKIRPFTFGA